MGKLILIIMLVIPGAWSANWEVTFADQCALRGTSAVIGCKYDYPAGNIIKTVKWSKARQTYSGWSLVPLSELSSSADHYKYIGNYRGNCNLMINNIQASDEGAYFFTFATLFTTLESKNSAFLSVKDLTAVVQLSTVTEGETVTLTCVSGCPKRIGIVWYKDGQRISGNVFQASMEDAGRYHCAVSGQMSVKSNSVALTVQHSPKKVALAVTPSEDILLGNNVTFTCSSDANPPVAQSGYSLYRDGEFLGFGSTLIISNIQPSQSGQYYCQASNGISQNTKDVFYSNKIKLDIMYRPMNIAISIHPELTEEGGSVNLTCNSFSNPVADNYTWYRRTDSAGSSSVVLVGSGQVLFVPSLSTTNHGLYFCQVRNCLGEGKSTEMMVNMAKKQRGIQSILVLAGVGVFLIVFLCVFLLIFWKKHHIVPQEKLTGRGLHTEHQSDAVYTNIDKFASSPPPDSHHDGLSSNDDFITYSTVIIKPKNLSPQHNTNSGRLSNKSWRNISKTDNSVIYATVAESSR